MKKGFKIFTIRIKMKQYYKIVILTIFALSCLGCTSKFAPLDTNNISNSIKEFSELPQEEVSTELINVKVLGHFYNEGPTDRGYKIYFALIAFYPNFQNDVTKARLSIKPSDELSKFYKQGMPVNDFERGGFLGRTDNFEDWLNVNLDGQKFSTTLGIRWMEIKCPLFNVKESDNTVMEYLYLNFNIGNDSEAFKLFLPEPINLADCPDYIQGYVNSGLSGGSMPQKVYNWFLNEGGH